MRLESRGIDSELADRDGSGSPDPAWIRATVAGGRRLGVRRTTSVADARKPGRAVGAEHAGPLSNRNPCRHAAAHQAKLASGGPGPAAAGSGGLANSPTCPR